jgi:hypothetical protein
MTIDRAGGGLFQRDADGVFVPSRAVPARSRSILRIERLAESAISTGLDDDKPLVTIVVAVVMIPLIEIEHVQ